MYVLNSFPNNCNSWNLYYFTTCIKISEFNAFFALVSTASSKAIITLTGHFKPGALSPTQTIHVLRSMSLLFFFVINKPTACLRPASSSSSELLFKMKLNSGIYIYIYIHTHTHIRIYIYIHIYLQTVLFRPSGPHLCSADDGMEVLHIYQ